MPWKPPPWSTPPQPAPDSEIVSLAATKCSLGIARELEPLTTANKNRVILALCAWLTQELEALETDLNP